MQNYTTKSGDTWDSIAFLLYGDEQQAKALIEANPEHIETIIFSGNVTLNAPEITIKSATDNLPPWKRGNA